MTGTPKHWPALAGVVLLAACANQPTTSASPPAAPALASGAPTPDVGPIAGLDGVYRSPEGTVSGGSACGTTRFGYPIRVTGGVATLQTVSSGQLEGKVASDGSLSIQQQRASLEGKFSGGVFSGNLTVGSQRSRSCVYALNYTKR